MNVSQCNVLWSPGNLTTTYRVVISRDRTGRQVTHAVPENTTICKRASLKLIHNNHCLTNPAPHFSFLFLLLQFFLLFFIFPLSEKLRAASQSRKKEVGLTPLAKVIEKWLEQQANDYLQLLFIYLFRRYRVPGLRKEKKKKQYSFFSFF